MQRYNKGGRITCYHDNNMGTFMSVTDRVSRVSYVLGRLLPFKGLPHKNKTQILGDIQVKIYNLGKF